jgi:DnaK suppressor protein
MNTDKLNELKAHLEQERAALERQLSQQGLGEVVVEEGFADSAQATAERSELMAVGEQHESLYKEVVAALARIEDGTYGRCENCGAEIPDERLEAVPTATLCVACKQAANGAAVRS